MAYATDEQIELLLDTVDGGKPQTLRHLVQYADEKAKEIQNKLAKEGIAKIRTSWNNLNTLQPVLQEMLNGMEDVTVHVVVSIQQKRKRVLADAALSGPAANQKHLKIWKGFEKTDKLSVGSAKTLRPVTRDLSNAYRPSEMEVRKKFVVSQFSPTTATMSGDGISKTFLHAWMVELKLEEYEDKAMEWIQQKGAGGFKEVLVTSLSCKTPILFLLWCQFIMNGIVANVPQLYHYIQRKHHIQ